jgi:hypothetical protein
MNFERRGEFENLDESHLDYDRFEHGNELGIVIRRTSSVILFLLLTTLTDYKLLSAIFIK